MSNRTVLSEEDAYELLAYLIASAETQLVEPAFYGPRRLIEAAAQLAEGISPRVAEADQAWLSQFTREASEKKGWARRDPQGFKTFLQESSAGIAGELKRRATSGGVVETGTASETASVDGK
ncbi:MAG: hypothetical protein QOF01_1803 [Thermomicrobiales bacterium]|nr:hypothetical protein [Thermomicrobiales bacterium]MEA2595334.1 hypothetical protein [Thermomicrobiales bacterium]